MWGVLLTELLISLQARYDILRASLNRDAQHRVEQKENYPLTYFT